MMNDLKPCRCGDDHPHLARTALGYFVDCGGFCMRATDIFNTPEQAIEAWNEMVAE